MIAPKTPKPTKAEERAAYEAVTARDEGRCVRCGRAGVVQRDHRQLRSQGGLTVPSNLGLLCPPCHEWKHANHTLAVAEGFTVPSWARPEWWPNLRWGVAWVLYFDQPDSHGHWWTEITDATATLLMRGEATG